MAETLGSLKAEVIDWLAGERVPESRVANAINDGIESLWESLILAALQVFTGGPVTLPLEAGDEGRILVSVLDPAAPLTLSAVTSGGLPGRTVGLRYTLVTESGSETLPSPFASLVLAANDVVQADPPPLVSGAFGWNVYGFSATVPALSYRKQNLEPLSFNDAWIEPDTGIVNDPNLPGLPAENTTGDNVFYIRHLEYRTTSGFYTAYNAGDLDSLMMRRSASVMGTGSEFQRYAWDLINQRQLEIRPAAGLSITPRYFYIVKPRRLRYDSAPLPFPTVPQTEYLRAKALSSVLATLYEFEAAAHWDGLAERALLRAARALTQTNQNRNDRVTPYLIS